MSRIKLFKIFLLLGLTAAFNGLSWAEEPKEKIYRETTPQELRAKLDDVEANRAAPFPLIDTRNPARYKAGHLHGAKSIPWKEMVPEDLPKDKGALIVFYCDGPG
jgi:3-mercaptopyruvate sulfurtransferase SseA